MIYFGLMLLIFILASALKFMNNIIMIEKEKNNIRAFEVNVTTPNDNEALDALNKLIDDSLSDWIILNRGYKENEYINSEEEKNITKAIGELVNSRVSPILLDKLSFYYSTESLPEVIATKVYIKVLNYVITINRLKE